jgi:tetratricopeptide (TPR) repeat protein
MASPVETILAQGKEQRINGEYDEAIALLHNVVEQQPDLAEAHLELGLAYCFTGLFEESIHELEIAARLDADNPEIQLHLAKTMTMLGRYEEGLHGFQAVLQLAPLGDPLHAEAARQLSYFQQFG